MLTWICYVLPCFNPALQVWWSWSIITVNNSHTYNLVHDCHMLLHSQQGLRVLLSSLVSFYEAPSIHIFAGAAAPPLPISLYSEFLILHVQHIACSQLLWTTCNCVTYKCQTSIQLYIMISWTSNDNTARRDYQASLVLHPGHSVKLALPRWCVTRYVIKMLCHSFECLITGSSPEDGLVSIY